MIKISVIFAALSMVPYFASAAATLGSCVDSIGGTSVLASNLTTGDLVTADQATIIRPVRDKLTMATTSRVLIITEANKAPKQYEIDAAGVIFNSLRVSPDKTHMYGTDGSNIISWNLKTGVRSVSNFENPVKLLGLAELSRVSTDERGPSPVDFLVLMKEDAVVTETQYLANDVILVKGYLASGRIENPRYWLSFTITTSPHAIATSASNNALRARAQDGAANANSRNNLTQERAQAIEAVNELPSGNWIRAANIRVDYGFEGLPSRFGLGATSNMIEVTPQNRREVISGQLVEYIHFERLDQRRLTVRILNDGKYIELKESYSGSGERIYEKLFDFWDSEQYQFSFSGNRQLIAGSPFGEAIGAHFRGPALFLWDSNGKQIAEIPTIEVLEKTVGKQVRADDFQVRGLYFPDSKSAVMIVFFRENGVIKEAKLKFNLSNLAEINSAHLEIVESRNDASRAYDYFVTIVSVESVREVGDFSPIPFPQR